MPNLAGLNLYEAQALLTTDGIYIPVPSFAFEPSQITITYRQSSQKPGIIIGQVPASGIQTNAGAAISLTLAAFPMSVSSEYS